MLRPDLLYVGSRQNGLRRAHYSFATLIRARQALTGADVSVANVRWLLCRQFILALQFGEPVLRIARQRLIVRGLEPKPVETRRIAAEYHLLDRAIGAAKGREAVFLLHVLGDL